MLTDDELLARLESSCRLGRRLDTRVILLLIEVEDRRLDLRSAYPSLYELCRRKLGMSEGTANRRVTAVKLVRRMPVLIEHLQRGLLTLSALMLVRNVITEANVEELVAKVAGKTRAHVEEVVASMAPKPDVPARLDLLPVPSGGAGAVAGVAETSTAATAPSSALSPGLPARAEPRARLAPLAEARWRLQLTADKALHEKIERARELMRHRTPTGDLTVIVAAAFDALLQKLEAPRKARPERRRRARKLGAVAAATRSAVFARDGEQCTYEDVRGQRCPSTTLLEVDHINARARGGSGELTNLRVRCRPHNKLHAEEDFGRAHIEARVREKKLKRSRAAVAEHRSGGSEVRAAANEPRRSRSSEEPRAGP